jgi:pimeloyl-ACP methyl ester carboxylesterase
MRFLASTALLLAGCPKPLPPNLVPDDVIVYETADGWQNTLRHYPGDGPPLLLVHGMSANHYNWDYREETSFIPDLVAAGFDVWVPGMRGDPGSEHPTRKAAKSYTFDDHARYDMPAAVDRVLEITGEDDLLWVGHSMGGMLLYTAASHYPDKIRAGVAISSPGIFANPIPIHKTASHARWLVKGNGLLRTKGIAHFALGLGLRRLVEKQVSTPDSMRLDLLKGMAHYVLAPLPKPMAHQALGWLKSGELTTVEGERWIGQVDLPMLLMAGPEDGVVSERDVAATCEQFSDCTYIQLSEDNGFSHDYGHVDPVVGRMAPIEVLPRLLDFLEVHRETASVPTAEAPVWITTPEPAGLR